MLLRDNRGIASISSDRLQPERWRRRANAESGAGRPVCCLATGQTLTAPLKTFSRGSRPLLAKFGDCPKLDCPIIPAELAAQEALRHFDPLESASSCVCWSRSPLVGAVGITHDSLM
jgi:hypothetical protein